METCSASNLGGLIASLAQPAFPGSIFALSKHRAVTGVLGRRLAAASPTLSPVSAQSHLSGPPITGQPALFLSGL